MEKVSKGGYNKVIIEVDPAKKYNDVVAGNIDIDVSYEGHKHVKGIGKVHAVPIGLRGFENDTIVPELEVGMEVVFHYSVVDDGTEDRDENLLGRYNGKDLYHCDYYHIYCARKESDDPWTMIGAWVLCDEHFERPVHVITYQDPLNKKMVEIPVTYTDSGIIAEAHAKRSSRIAKIVNIGKPLTDRNELYVSLGDLIVFRNNVDGEISIGGKRYVLLRQEELLINLGSETKL